MMRFLAAALALAAVAPPALAQEASKGVPPPERLESVLEPLRKKHGVPALGAAVVSAGRVVAIGATGVRKHGDEEQVTDRDKWHIGSCTKSMTATLVARMVDRGDLAWKTTLAEAFPELKDEMDPAFRGVTLELLLTNRSGAPKKLDAGGLWGRLWERKGTPVEQRRQLLEGVVKRPPAYPPGKQKLYSNAGFAIAGHVAESQAGKAWEELLRKEVFEPLGMKSAGFGVPWSPDEVKQPWGHRPTPGGPVPVRPGPLADNPPSIGPGGTVHCSLRDWAKYLAVHARTEAGKPEIVKTATLRKLHTSPKGSDYAFGWIVVRRSPDEAPVLWHNGSNTSWYALAWISPSRELAVLTTCNMGGSAADKACGELTGALVRRFVSK